MISTDTDLFLANAREGVSLHPGDGDLRIYRFLERQGLAMIAGYAHCTHVHGPKSGGKCDGCAKCDGWLRVQLTDAGRARLGG